MRCPMTRAREKRGQVAGLSVQSPRPRAFFDYVDQPSSSWPGSSPEVEYTRLAALRAFSGKVDTGFPQKMRPLKEVRARFRFNLIGTRSNGADLGQARGPMPSTSCLRHNRRGCPEQSGLTAHSLLNHFENSLIDVSRIRYWSASNAALPTVVSFEPGASLRASGLPIFFAMLVATRGGPLGETQRYHTVVCNG
jgi:hypothetical protein